MAQPEAKSAMQDVNAMRSFFIAPLVRRSNKRRDAQRVNLNK
jgi:hypothetical protein